MSDSQETADVVIVGGGVIGMSVAYFLSQRRELSILVIDQNRPGCASMASAGGLWPIGESVGLGCGVIFFKTLSKRRRERGEAVAIDRPHQLPAFFFDFCLTSNAMFPALWETLKADTGVDFKLERTGLKFVMYDEDDVTYANHIYSSIPHLAHHMQWLDANDLRTREPQVNPAAVGALEFLYDDQVSPFLLTQAYEAGARANGVRVLRDVEVNGVDLHGGRVVSVRAGGRTISCGLMVNAAGAWADQLAHMVGISVPVTPVRGQIVLSERLPKGFLNGCLSTSDCYLAQKDNGEVLIGSTTEQAGFDTTTSVAELRELTRGAVRAVPALARVNIKRTWAGLRPGTPDEIPILGPVPGLKGYLNACGHFRTGMLTSAITGQILHDLVFGATPPIDLTPFLWQRFSRKPGVGEPQHGLPSLSLEDSLATS